MPSCGICTGTISSKKPGLLCSGTCDKYYHGKCVSLNKDEIFRFAKPDAHWFCSDCRSSVRRSTRMSVIGVPAGDVAEDDVVDSSDSLRILMDLRNELKALHNKYDNILESVNFCSNQITSFESTLKNFDIKLTALEKISQENQILKTQVSQLSSRLESAEQQIRSNNIEINGVPEKENENLLLILERIGEHISKSITPTIVDHVYRASKFSSNQPKSIIVKFTSRKEKDEILAAAKLKRLNCRNPSGPGFGIENVSKNLFINEHLTSFTKSLLRNAKSAARSRNYKYVWVRNNAVFVRKDDRAKAVRILSDNDLNKIV